jgi:hypothetical protein
VSEASLDSVSGAAPPNRRLNTLARIPTEPHPSNVASHEAYRKLYPDRIDVRAFLLDRLADIRERKPQTSFVAWCGCEALADAIQKRLEDLAKHPDRPLGPKAVRQLRRALIAMRIDLETTRPF